MNKITFENKFLRLMQLKVILTSDLEANLEVANEQTKHGHMHMK